MDWVQPFVLGLVQGVTEFLPISSSAHLILTPKFFGWQDQGLLFDISVHVGTLAAVLLYFRSEVMTLALGKWHVVTGRMTTVPARLFLMLVASTIPLILIAPFMKDIVELYARSFTVIGFTSIVFGLLLWWADKKSEKWHSVGDIRTKQAWIFGFYQVLAMVPGTSRSGICMTAGRLMGFDRKTASRYAMLMAMPVIFLIGGYSLVSDFHSGFNFQENAEAIALGAGVSFVSALAAIHLLMTFVERIGFLPFVVYRVLLGLFLLLLAYFGG